MRTPPTPIATPARERTWSPAEKTAARKAFNLALERELESIIEEAKARAASITRPSELWELESWLTRRRHEIDNKYDFRYSVLPGVFATLLREERIAFGGPAGTRQPQARDHPLFGWPLSQSRISAQRRMNGREVQSRPYAERSSSPSGIALTSSPPSRP